MSYKVEIITPESCKEQMENEYVNGPIKGTTTYNKELDNAWTWRPGEYNIWTGYANEGKSEMLKQLCLIKALEEDKATRLLNVLIVVPLLLLSWILPAAI